MTEISENKYRWMLVRAAQVVALMMGLVCGMKMTSEWMLLFILITGEMSLANGQRIFHIL